MSPSLEPSVRYRWLGGKSGCACALEATTGFEPVIRVLQTLALTTWPRRRLERETGFEPATFSLARRCSTPEPLPRDTACCSRPASMLYPPCPWPVNPLRSLSSQRGTAQLRQPCDKIDQPPRAGVQLWPGFCLRIP